MTELENQLNIIGIGGLGRSGKDTLAELLIESGYFGVSLGDIVRNISRERHAETTSPISRANMTETSNWLRKTRGPDFALKDAIDQFNNNQSTTEPYKGLLVWSVRAPIEADFILAQHGSLVWLEASDEVRHSRAMSSLRPGESRIPIEVFLKEEVEEWKPQPQLPVEVQMDLSYIKEHATHTLVNNFDNLQSFISMAKALIEKIS